MIRNRLKKFIDSFTEEGSILSDDFCKSLTTVRFIDCLRREVKRNKELFERIECIAKELLGTEKWKCFPNLSVLLLSIARSFLKDEYKEDVTETSLYKVVKELYSLYYDNLKKESDGQCDSDSIDILLEAGIQLSRFQDKDVQRNFTNLKIQYDERMRALRRHYHSAENPRAFSERYVERWKWLNSKGEAAGAVAKFNELDKDKNEPGQNKLEDDLHPMRLELPIRMKNSSALKFANNFTQSLQKEKDIKKSVQNLAKKFRIIQWDVFIRDIVKEDRTGILHFSPITTQHTDTIGIPYEGFLKKFINSARLVECYIPVEEDIPTQLRYKKLSTEDSPLKKADEKIEERDISDESFDKKIEECSESFKRLLAQVDKDDFHKDLIHPFHKDLIASFTNRQKILQQSSSSMLIEDGELSFFSLLWLLRNEKGEKLENWKFTPDTPEKKEDGEFNPEKKLELSFRYGDDESWSKCNMDEFAEECGFIIRLTNSKGCIPTRRWKALITWLRRLNHSMKEGNQLPVDQKGFKVKELHKELPVKALDYKGEEALFVGKLWQFLESPPLRDLLNKLGGSDESLFDKELKELLDKFDKSPFDTVMSNKDFAKVLGSLVELLSKADLLSNSDAGLKDKVLFRCCRAFIPLESLFRAYQPYQLHLLMQALNWEKLFGDNLDESPIALGFASIVGRVEIETKNSEDTMTDFDNWVAPYRSLFSNLSADLTLPAVQRDSKQIGEQDQQSTFSHQTAGLINTIWSDQTRKLDNKSEFALWLARIHVVKIWGNLPLDPNEPIEMDFAEWNGLNNNIIVDKLINLGTHGGVLRARQYPKNLRTSEDERLRLRNHALRLGISEPGIGQVLSSLNFNKPTDTPPNWVNTTIFAMCFYHGMRQAVYHALEARVLHYSNQSSIQYLWIEWNNQSLSIYNRGIVTEEQRSPNWATSDSHFFRAVASKIDEFCYQNEIKEKIKFKGPKPATHISDDAWQWEIRKEHG